MEKEKEATMKKTVIIPAEVMENEAYKNLSDGARILFGILTEKKEKAEKNDWIDPHGSRYVVFPKRQMQEELDCSRYWVDQFTKELETMGLIKLGYLYKPVIERRFYVRTFDGDIPSILVEYGAEEPMGAETKEAPFEKEKSGETDKAADETKTEVQEDPSIAPLPAGCPMRDSDVKELAFDLLNVMAGVVEELFRDPDDKPAA